MGISYFSLWSADYKTFRTWSTDKIISAIFIQMNLFELFRFHLFKKNIRIFLEKVLFRLYEYLLLFHEIIILIKFDHIKRSYFCSIAT